MDIIYNDLIVGDYDYTIQNDNSIFINRIYIDEDYRNLKIGSTILNNIINQNKDKNYIELIAMPINKDDEFIWIPIAEAIKEENKLKQFYSKFGFIESKVKRNLMILRIN